MTAFTAADIPDQSGKTAIVTGATGGLGYETARLLAGAGATVILAGRNADKGADALRRLRSLQPKADIAFELIDLGSLASIADFSGRMNGRLDRLEILVNNAGVMSPPQRQTTTDGFELQFGTNYLSHFALTGHLLALLRQTANARVISLGSVAARAGQIDLTDLQSQARYRPMTAYSQSKLACVMFALEFERRSVAGNWGVSSLAAHPGVSRTDLLHNAPGRWSASGLARSLLWFVFQPAAQGALPTLYAATAPTARGSDYYGPARLGETRGEVAPAQIPAKAKDADIARRLWTASEQLTGVTFA